MELFHLKFPILIHLLNNKARHVVMSWEDLPVEHYFKILQTGIDPNNLNVEIEVEYRRIDEPVSKEVISDEQTQENNEPSSADSADDGASNGSANSDGTG